MSSWVSGGGKFALTKLGVDHKAFDSTTTLEAPFGIFTIIPPWANHFSKPRSSIFYPSSILVLSLKFRKQSQPLSVMIVSPTSRPLMICGQIFSLTHHYQLFLLVTWSLPFSDLLLGITPSAALAEHIQEILSLYTGVDDSKVWSLESNCIFSIKSFYYFLNNGDLRCPIGSTFWKDLSP